MDSSFYAKNLGDIPTRSPQRGRQIKVGYF